jgi:hypothetical protein
VPAMAAISQMGRVEGCARRERRLQKAVGQSLRIRRSREPRHARHSFESQCRLRCIALCRLLQNNFRNVAGEGFAPPFPPRATRRWP